MFFSPLRQTLFLPIFFSYTGTRWIDYYDQVIKEKVRPPFNKYTVRAPKDLRSKYELKMEERRLKQQADEEQLHREAEELRLHVCAVCSLAVLFFYTNCTSISWWLLIIMPRP